MMKCAVAAALTVTSAPRAQVDYTPIEEADKGASLVAFKQQLKEAVSRRDARALEAMLIPAIRVGFGRREVGLKAFRSVWQPDSRTSGLWSSLERVLALGGAFEARLPGGYMMPYLAAKDYRIPDHHAVLVGADVPLRATPAPDGQVLRRGGFELVRLLSTAAEFVERDWVKVALGENEGWVAMPQVWRPTDFRVRLVKTDAGWKIAIVVSGD